MSERNYQALQEAGNRAGLEKLRENEHKGGWEHLSMEDLIRFLHQEVYELICCNPTDYKNVRREAADVRNFSDMIIQRCDRELGNDK